MSFYIPFICESDSNSDMYALSTDHREHQPNSIRYRVLAKNYFNPSQKWWRSSPFYSKSKLNSGARVLVENGELLPAWRYSLLANEREKWMRDYWLQSCRNLYYTLQSEEYILPSIVYKIYISRDSTYWKYPSILINFCFVWDIL